MSLDSILNSKRLDPSLKLSLVPPRPIIPKTMNGLPFRTRSNPIQNKSSPLSPHNRMSLDSLNTLKDQLPRRFVPCYHHAWSKELLLRTHRMTSSRPARRVALEDFANSSPLPCASRQQGWLRISRCSHQGSPSEGRVQVEPDLPRVGDSSPH